MNSRYSQPGERNGGAKLTDAAAAEIRRLYWSGMVSQQALADEYGVSQKAVWRIVNGKGYASEPAA
jgi:DNA invertase Pin-like site-specific DNA recombinase